MKGSAPFLKMYTEFVSGFSNSSSLICTHYRKTPRFAAVMEEIHVSDGLNVLLWQQWATEPDPIVNLWFLVWLSSSAFGKQT